MPEEHPTEKPYGEERPSEHTSPSLPPAAPGAERDGVPWGFAFGSLLLAAVIVFAVQNSEPVPIHFLGWSGRFPLSIAVTVAVLATVVLTQSIGAIARRRRRRRKADKEALRVLRGDG